MVPFKNRLPRDAFRARGYRVVSTPFFSLRTKDNELGVNRIGVVVSKSIDKRATRRNFWERQAKDQLLKAPNFGKDFIFIAFPTIQKISRQELVEEIKKILKKMER
jgi:ribonuclease P protein component